MLFIIAVWVVVTAYFNVAWMTNKDGQMTPMEMDAGTIPIPELWRGVFIGCLNYGLSASKCLLGKGL